MPRKLIVALTATLLLAASYASAATVEHWAHNGAKWAQARDSVESGQLYSRGGGSLFDRARGHIE